MNNTNIILLIVVLAITITVVSGIVVSEVYHVTEVNNSVIIDTPIEVPNESVNLTNNFISYFNYQSSRYRAAPPVIRSQELDDLAMKNAMAGTKSFKIRANSSGEAISIFETMEWSDWNKYAVDLISGIGFKSGSSWGIATYHYDNIYNVSVVYKPAPYIRTVKGDDGVYVSVTDPITPQYLFNDA